MSELVEYRCNNCGHEGHNARAVPYVPELVRYRLNSLGELIYSEKGQYVLYSQAAAVIAAKDKEIQELKEKLGVVSTERHADAEYIGHLQAELAQIKAQEPVGYVSQYGFNKLASRSFQQMVDVRKSIEGEHNIPLYAAPVDQTAEIERLREVAKKVIARWDSPHWKVTAPTADVMNELRAAISGKESK